MRDDDTVHAKSAKFTTTRWTLVGHAQNPLSDQHVQAVSALASKYWKPVYYFIRAKGYPLQRAEDLTQEFFLNFLERDWIRRADRTRGRFRTFLLAILVRFLCDQGPRRGSRQKRFEQAIVSVSSLLTDKDRKFEPAKGESPDDIFMQRWAAGLMEHVCAEVEQDFAAQGEAVRYQVFRDACLAESERKLSQMALAKQYGLSRDQVRTALDQVREAFRRAFRNELRLDGCSKSEIEGELGDLMRLVEA